MDEPVVYRVYYEDPSADQIGDPPFTEVIAISEDDAMSKARNSDNRDWTHAGYWGDDEYLIDEA